MRIHDQDKLYQRMMKAVAKLEDWGKANGFGVDYVFQQIKDEARKRGLQMPTPGKDY